jgi:hypothetical protein
MGESLHYSGHEMFIAISAPSTKAIVLVKFCSKYGWAVVPYSHAEDDSHI